MTKNIKKFSLIICLCIVIVSFQNCSGGQHSNSSDFTQTTVDIGALQAAAVGVLSTQCASCHSPDSGVDSNIENILDIQQLLLNEYIVAGQPQNSPIYVSAVDGIMPHESDDLSPLEIDSLRDWIIALGDPAVGAGIILPPVFDEDGNVVSSEFQAVNSIIQSRCLSCHNGGNPAGGLNLSGFTNVVASVAPGNATGSLLYQSVINDISPMPPSPQPRLSNGDRAIIRNWINNGANP